MAVVGGVVAVAAVPGKKLSIIAYYLAELHRLILILEKVLKIELFLSRHA